MDMLFRRVIKPAYLQTRYVRSRLGDRQLGIMTTDECVADEIRQKFSLEHPYPGGTHRAISFTAVHRLMRRLEPNQGDALLDYGCGAGRMLCVAAQYPFSRIVGIEIDEQVHALAERNAQNLRRFLIRPEVLCADATTYQVPEEITIAFLYNSFNGEILRSALTRLIESYDRAPRRLRLIYANPKEHDLVMSMKRWRETDQLRMSWRPGTEWARTQMIRFYEVKARD
jgi:SAM-dependent methyltransferase